jgi:hypothetical protein
MRSSIDWTVRLRNGGALFMPGALCYVWASSTLWPAMRNASASGRQLRAPPLWRVVHARRVPGSAGWAFGLSCGMCVSLLVVAQPHTHFLYII